jgi:2-iminobutanoate/2-iminopropanoate deaminase
MDVEAVHNDRMPPALGPYSHVVRAGELLFVSGQPGIDPGTGEVPPGGFEAEARQAFANLRTVLEAAGASLGRVVKTTVFLVSGEDFAALNAVYGEVFPSAPPARATPVVGLPRDLRISVEAVAAR